MAQKVQFSMHMQYRLIRYENVMVQVMTCSVARTFQQVVNLSDLKELRLQLWHSSSGGLLERPCIRADPRWS